MSLTTDPADPRLTHGMDSKPTEQAKAYLVLSDEELAKGFVRPVRRSYVHEYMLDGSDVPTVIVTRKGMAGCGALTTMHKTIAETYAKDPKFYGATYCMGCKKHLPVGQFHWDGSHEKVGS